MIFFVLDNMQERQLIFESVLPTELDPARFSKPIIDGIEQSLTSNSDMRWSELAFGPFSFLWRS
jgi:hypothetical protein